MSNMPAGPINLCRDLSSFLTAAEIKIFSRLTLKVEAAGSSETFVNITIQRRSIKVYNKQSKYYLHGDY
jgi:hypothetical protein